MSVLSSCRSQGAISRPLLDGPREGFFDGHSAAADEHGTRAFLGLGERSESANAPSLGKDESAHRACGAHAGLSGWNSTGAEDLVGRSRSRERGRSLRDVPDGFLQYARNAG